MTRIFADLRALAHAAVARGGTRRVRRAFVPEPSPDPARDAEFGLLELDDGSAGLYYAWMGASQAGMAARFPEGTLAGCDALEIIDGYTAGDDAACALALAALNALTASVWRHARYTPPVAHSSFGMDLRAGDALGMIGNFPSLVRQARGQGVEVIVVERKAHMVVREPGLEITLDPAALGRCRRIVCTAATLVNDSFDDMLSYCPPTAEIVVLGPTAGGFPEPFFARGVTTLGGTLVHDAGLAREQLAQGGRLTDCATRYTLSLRDYPGTRTLLTHL